MYKAVHPTHSYTQMLKRNLSTDIYERLKQRIMYWEYLPGSRLTEEALCEEFNVSRSPVWEALGTLVEQGLVEKEPHKGYTVRQPDMGEILELYDVRLALEMYVVEWLAVNGMEDAVWNKLYKFWTDICENQPRGDLDFAREDEHFHEALVAATGNQILLQQYTSVIERLHYIRLMDITSDDKWIKTCNHHLKVLDFIREGDAESARNAIQKNIYEGRKNVDQAVKEILAKTYMGTKPRT